MKAKTLPSVVRVLSLLLLISATCAFAQDRNTMHFSGVLNDYTPLLSTVKGSPWETHGQWSVDIHPGWGTADFAADITMSGFGRTTVPASDPTQPPVTVVDPTQPLVNPHTHHIQFTNAKIEWDLIGCPQYQTPVPTKGFQFTQTLSLMTGNGLVAPFETNPPTSMLQVCISGGDGSKGTITNSNITMTFTGPATMHFGTQAIHGVVRKPTPDPSGKDR